MVRAILEGRKTMTRRVVTHPAARHWTDGRFPGADKPIFLAMAGGQGGHQGNWIACPYGQPGDRLWVRETWATWPSMDATKPSRIYQQPVHYAATFDESKILYPPSMSKKWRPSIFMPRWASRITLEVTGVKVERVQDISKADAISEGVDLAEEGSLIGPRFNFMNLWDSINAKRGFGWDVNPWVWVISFRVIK